MATKIQTGSNTAGLQNVDENYNAQINLPYTKPGGTTVGGGNAAAGFASMLSERDSGNITGTRTVLPPEVTTNYRLRTAQDQFQFNEAFPGSALNSSIWTAPVAGMTTVVNAGALVLNSGSALTASSVARVSSYEHFAVNLTYPLYWSSLAQISAVPNAGAVLEWGMAFATSTSAVTDGAYFTVNSAGELRCVVTTNSVVAQSDVLDFNALIGVNTSRYFLIYIGAERITFWIDNDCAFDLKLSTVSSSGLTVFSPQLPILFRAYNTSLVVGTIPLLKIHSVNVATGEGLLNKPWSHVCSAAGGMAYQGQTGNTLGSTALLTNSLAPGAGAAMTNTTAALGSGLGGQFTALPTLTVNTDGILSSYQVPTSSLAIPGKKLHITGVSISSVVSTVLAGNATPVVYVYSLCFGHNAVSLITSTTTTSKAPVRIPLGVETFAAAAAVATLGQGVTRKFDSPIVVYPGEFVQVVAKNIGAVTTTGAITFLITFDGYFD
jgi:hypothetical protein